MDPVFIHSLWRSGSTYLWNRFRVLPDIHAYYEPFQEALGAGSREELGVLTPESWTSRHPHLEQPYYTEYLPLVGEHGIPEFEKGFSIDHYFEEDPSVLAGDRRYIARLIDYATSLSRTAVLGCCRTLGRAPWLKAEFGGTHIVLIRNPRQQWYSGYLRKQQDGHAYFEVMPFQILGKSTWRPARQVAKLLGIPTFDASSFFMEYERYFSLFGAAEPERSYAAFYAVQRLSLNRALPAADLVIDIDRLSGLPAVRADMEHRVRAATGLPVSFQDSAIAHHNIPSDLVDFAAIERGVDAMLGQDSPARFPIPAADQLKARQTGEQGARA